MMKCFKYALAALVFVVLLNVGVLGYGYAKYSMTRPIYSTEEYRGLERQPIVSVELDSGFNLVAKVTNTTGETLKYNGYRDGNPLLWHEAKMNNEWTGVKQFICGTGLSNHSLKNNESIVIRLNYLAQWYATPTGYHLEKKLVGNPNNSNRTSITFYDTRNKQYGKVILYEG